MNARQILARGGAGRRAAETRMIVTICTAIAAASFVYGYVHAGEQYPAIVSGLQGIVNSLMAAVPLIAFEIKGRRLAAVSRLRRLPFAWFLLFKIALYLAIMVATILVTRWLFAESTRFDERFRDNLLFATLMAVGSNLVIEIGGLVGFGVLRRLFTGRYFHPRREERVFAVIDMAKSTSTAERLGDLDFHALLRAFFADIGDAAYDYDAEIHKYVGDEAILSWPVSSGLKDSRAALCVFAVARAIQRRADWYSDRFGVVPSFRAALHIGFVAAGEIGQQRREIAYVGDTLNTASRLLDAARDAGRDVVVSQALLDRLSLPEGLTVEPLPPADAAGKREKVKLAALALA
ncbi:MAG: adenylate/guanylate cyclase domain-containing protein [Reyranellaceae bacterium]